MANDPAKTFYILGYSDASDGKKNRRVPYQFKLAYVSGRYDAVTKKVLRYDTHGVN